MEEGKPGFLAEVRALAAHLEISPTFLFVFLRKFGVYQLVFLVVGVDQVLNYRSGLAFYQSMTSKRGTAGGCLLPTE